MITRLLSGSPAGGLGDVAPDRVLVAGDWHGNDRWATHILEVAHRCGISHVLHLGDFGFWHGRSGADYLASVNSQLAEYGQTLWFVDGNHEDHHKLLDLPIDPDTGVRPVAERIFHLPRGIRWRWHGRTWMGLGGAVSVDRAQRTPGETWWPHEAITEYQERFAIEPGPVDVMLTHDCPDRVDIPGLSDGWPLDALSDSWDNQALLGRVVDAVQPELLLHGHFHVRYDAVRGARDGRDCRIVGLDCDGDHVMSNAIIADTATLDIQPLEGAETLQRVRNTMGAAGIGIGDVEPDLVDARWREELGRTLAGWRPFTSLHLALVAETCGVEVDDLIGRDGTADRP